MEKPIAQPESPLEILRRLENLIRVGTIAEVRHGQPARCRVRTGELLTNWIPWLSLRAGDAVTWFPPSAGEQCLLISPGGDLLNAFALPGAYSDAHPQNSVKPTEHRTTWANGDTMVHDSADGSFQLLCTGRIDIVGSTIHLNEPA